MDKLDKVTKTVLVYVLTFVDEIIKHKDQNHADPVMIYTVFSNVLIRRRELNSGDSYKVVPVKNSIKVITTLIKFCVVWILVGFWCSDIFTYLHFNDELFFFQPQLQIRQIALIYYY